MSPPIYGGTQGSIAGIGGSFYTRPQTRQMVVSSNIPPHTCGTLPPNFQLSKYASTNSCSRLPSSDGDSCDEALTEASRQKSNVIRMKSFGSAISISRCRAPACIASAQLSASQHHLPIAGDYGGNSSSNNGNSSSGGGVGGCPETVTITTKVS